MSEGCTKRAIYPGTFDPVTNGHLDLIRRALKMFDEVIVAVSTNPSKNPLFTPAERIVLIRESVADMPGVTVESFGGLLVDYAKTRGGVAIIRGLRAVSDFEYELQMALMNRKLDLELETVFLMPSLRYIFLSSTIVKEAASYGGAVGDLVPPGVARALAKKYPRR
jgi:pantetheine-phosphate adenylyltransferase